VSGERLEPGNVLQVLGCGIWITGESGCGKSELSLALVDRGHRLVADDVAWLTRNGNRVEARADPAQFGMLHVRDLGLLEIGHLFGTDSLLELTTLRLIVDLARGGRTPDATELLRGRRSRRCILGVELPCLTLQADAARPLALLVECAVRKFRKDEGERPPGESGPDRAEDRACA